MREVKTRAALKKKAALKEEEEVLAVSEYYLVLLEDRHQGRTVHPQSVDKKRNACLFPHIWEEA